MRHGGRAPVRRRRHRRPVVGRGRPGSCARPTRVEAALERALPGSDVVVHVEPLVDAGGARARPCGRDRGAGRARDPQPRARGAGRSQGALAAPEAAGGRDAGEAHDVAEGLEAAICERRAGARRRPVAPRAADRGRRRRARSSATPRVVERIVREVTGCRAALPPLPADGRGPRRLPHARARRQSSSLEDAHSRASEIEERIRLEAPEIADVIVHTEP